MTEIIDTPQENHLKNEQSLYLHQHAGNPVDWYPWGEEAITKASLEEKPIILSIGYSTCHWCHVMERESFCDAAIARFMNENFICIKVDREERPDLDKIYITAVSALSGNAGWPLNVFLSPDLVPFFGGTYFPPEPHWKHPSWQQVIEAVAASWNNPEERAKLISTGNRVFEHIQGFLNNSNGAQEPDMALMHKAFIEFSESYDHKNGGFGNAPKFPQPTVISFLFRYYYAFRKDSSYSIHATKAREMALYTLGCVINGGIHDQLGGGFHRYSTDNAWHVPHFEKMLYDNAQLVSVMLDGYQICGEKELALTARSTLDYLLREMCHPEGGFFSAEDADSLLHDDSEIKTEGAFYAWSAEEIKSILEPDIAKIVKYHFGIATAGNAGESTTTELAGKNVLYVSNSIKNTAEYFDVTNAEIERILLNAKNSLLHHRKLRPRPIRDDKIITSWNGLAISAFARASMILGDRRYLDAACNCAGFLYNNLFEHNGTELWRTWSNGKRGSRATSEDYALLILGLVDLYEAGFEIRWLQWAVELLNSLIARFYDDENGGFYLTEKGLDSNLILRPREMYDGVIPSSTSAGTMALLRLHHYTDRVDYLKKAETTIRSVMDALKQAPSAMPSMLSVMDLARSNIVSVVVLGELDRTETKDVLSLVSKFFLPRRSLILLENNEMQMKAAEWQPFLRYMRRLNGKPTVYVCRKQTCLAPTSDLDHLLKLLAEEAG